MNNPLFLVFYLFVLIFSIMMHEIAHGAVALRLGDQTAKLAGRLTLNPAKHLDFFGSFLLPISLYFLSGGTVVFGWAKPVPYNPLNLRNPKLGAGIIAVAGPLSNLLIASVFGILIRTLGDGALLGAPIISLFGVIVYMNVLLAIFNLVPLPPLDGSGILFSLLPSSARSLHQFLMRYGFFVLIFFIVFGFPYLTPLVEKVYQFMVGGVGVF